MFSKKQLSVIHLPKINEQIFTLSLSSLSQTLDIFSHGQWSDIRIILKSFAVTENRWRLHKPPSKTLLSFIHRKYKSRQERITSLGHSQSACHINPYSSVKALAQHNTRHGHPVNQANDSGKEKGKKYVWQIRPHPSANTPRSSTTLIHHPNSPPKPSWNPPFSITSISQDHHNRSSLRLP